MGDSTSCNHNTTCVGNSVYSAEDHQNSDCHTPSAWMNTHTHVCRLLIHTADVSSGSAMLTLWRKKEQKENNKSIQSMIDHPFHDSVVAIIWCRMLITLDSRVTASKFILSLQQPRKERKEKRKETDLDVLAFQNLSSHVWGINLKSSSIMSCARHLKSP